MCFGVVLGIIAFCLGLVGLTFCISKYKYICKPSRYDDNDKYKNVPFVLLGFYAAKDGAITGKAAKRAMRDFKIVYGHLPRDEIVRDAETLIKYGYLGVNIAEPKQ